MLNTESGELESSSEGQQATITKSNESSNESFLS